MHRHNRYRICAGIANHAQDTIISLSDHGQPMFHPWVIFIRFFSLRIGRGLFQPRSFNFSFAHANPGVFGQLVLHAPGVVWSGGLEAASLSASESFASKPDEANELLFCEERARGIVRHEGR
jgi:hypothetical protein